MADETVAWRNDSMVHLPAAMTKWKVYPYAAVALFLCVITGTEGVQGHGAYHELVVAMTADIEKQPTNAELYRRRAHVHVEHEDWQTALVDLEMADRLSHEPVESDFLRGRALLLGRHFKEARQCLNEYIDAHPNLGTPRLFRARVLGALELNEDAFLDYQHGYSLLPQVEPDHVFELAQFANLAGGPERALAAMEDGMRRIGPLAALVDQAVKLEVSLKRYDAAVKRLNDALANTQLKTPWMAKRAELLTQAGRKSEADQAWQTLVDHILAMPTLERGSHSMCRLLEQAQQALGKAPASAPVIAAPSRTSFSANTPPSSPHP